jgi:hypothetical protein
MFPFSGPATVDKCEFHHNLAAVEMKLIHLLHPSPSQDVAALFRLHNSDNEPPARFILPLNLFDWCPVESSYRRRSSLTLVFCYCAAVSAC